MNLYKNFLSLIFAIALPAIVSADLTLSFSDADVLAGDQVAVTASISNDMLTQELSGYNFTIDVANDGNSLPSGVSLNLAASSSLATNLVNFALTDGLPTAFDFDVIASDSSGGSGSETVSATPLDLFTLVFDVDPSVAVGTEFDVSFVQPAIAAQFSITLDTITANFRAIDVVQSGTVTVVGVPEPAASVALLVLGATGLNRRRRK